MAGEAELQSMIAINPGLIRAAGESLMLVSREHAVPQSSSENARRWRLDHLFVDIDAVPVLVEVKVSGERMLRREFIGQMMEYASHGSRYWTSEGLKLSFQESCANEGLDASARLAAFLGGRETPDSFWKAVECNSREGRIRMVFAAYEIGDELKQTVDFMNRHMSPAELLVVEIPRPQHLDLAIRERVEPHEVVPFPNSFWEFFTLRHVVKKMQTTEVGRICESWRRSGFIEEYASGYFYTNSPWRKRFSDRKDEALAFMNGHPVLTVASALRAYGWTAMSSGNDLLEIAIPFPTNIDPVPSRPDAQQTVRDHQWFHAVMPLCSITKEGLLPPLDYVFADLIMQRERDRRFGWPERLIPNCFATGNNEDQHDLVSRIFSAGKKLEIPKDLITEFVFEMKNLPRPQIETDEVTPSPTL